MYNNKNRMCKRNLIWETKIRRHRYDNLNIIPNCFVTGVSTYYNNTVKMEKDNPVRLESKLK